MFVDHVFSVFQMHDRGLDQAQSDAFCEATLNINTVRLVYQALQIKIIQHVLEGTIRKVLADRIANLGVVSV